jgi:hypothetical protein
MIPHASPLADLDRALTALAGTLPRAMDLLSVRRAADVPAGHLEDYVAQGWMRWAAGRLVITPQGTAMRDAVVDRELP